MTARRLLPAALATVATAGLAWALLATPATAVRARASKCGPRDTQVVFSVRAVNLRETLNYHDNSSLDNTIDAVVTGRAKGRFRNIHGARLSFTNGPCGSGGAGYFLLPLPLAYAMRGTKQSTEVGPPHNKPHVVTRSCTQRLRRSTYAGGGEGDAVRRRGRTVKVEIDLPAGVLEGFECGGQTFGYGSITHATLKVPEATLLQRRRVRLRVRAASRVRSQGQSVDDAWTGSIVLVRYRKCGPLSKPLACVIVP